MENNEEPQPSNSKLENTDNKTKNDSQDATNQLTDLTLNPVNRRDSESLKTDSIKNDSCSSASGSKSFNHPPLNLELLNELEIEANRVAASVDDLTENLTGILRSISALTLDCLETYRNCICKTCDAIDYNIKLMYQLMAKCEELSKVAEPLNALSQNVKDIKNVLDLFDNTMNPCFKMAAAQIDGSISEDQIKSFKDFLLSYNKLSEICFDACAFDFTQRQVKKQEESCALNCMEKYLKMTQRISQRFQEYQMVMNENALAASQKLSGK